MNKVFDYIASRQQQFIDELQQYLRFPSVSAQPQHKPDMEACAGWLAEHCRKIGLTTQIHPTKGHPIVTATTGRSHKPHYLVYGHYDVQPPEPLDLWQTPPFEPRIKNGKLYARGASDNKGQHFAHLKAVEAYLKTGQELPCDLTFVIEGEEEVGSNNLPLFLRSRKKEFNCQSVVISDTGMPSFQQPALTYALRGIAAVEVTVHGPNRDLHSGIFGGSVDNPAMVLAQILAQLRDKKGRVAIPGFYDEVLPLSKFERKENARLKLDEKKYQKFLGVPALFGEAGFTTNERRSARPTLEINGLTSGYQGEGSKTIIPAWARAKLTLRLVPNQNPAKIMKLVHERLRKLCPPTVRLELVSGHGAEPYLVPPQGPEAQAGLRALEKAFGKKPVLLREGGSIPIVNEFKRILGVNSLMLGLALPDDNAHSPNEKFELVSFFKGMEMSARLWQELTA